MQQDSYGTHRHSHFGVCNSFRVFAPAGESNHTSAHGGWEVLLSDQELGYATPSMKVRGNDFVITPRRMLLFNGMEEHIERYSEKQPTKLKAIVLAPEMLKEILLECGVDPTQTVFDKVAYDLTSEVMELLSNLFMLREIQSESPVAFECLAVELIIMLAERCPSTAQVRMRRALSCGRYPSNVVKVKKILSENRTNAELNLDELSRRAGISKFHLIRSFKEATGMGPFKYLNLVRFELAKARLKRGEGVLEVAEELGFSSYAAFNKLFKRNCGKPPSFFRS